MRSVPLALPMEIRIPTSSHAHPRTPPGQATATDQLHAQAVLAKSEREAPMQCLLMGFLTIHIPMRQVRGAGLQWLSEDVEGLNGRSRSRIWGYSWIYFPDRLMLHARPARYTSWCVPELPTSVIIWVDFFTNLPMKATKDLHPKQRDSSPSPDLVNNI